MNILIISHEYPPIGGGGANACMYLSKEYARHGHSIDIITVWWEGTQEKEISVDNTIRIFRIRAKRQKKESCSFAEMLDFIIKAKTKADDLVKGKKNTNSNYDICQIFFGIPSGVIGYYLKKEYHLPYVVRFGGGDIPGFQARFKQVYKIISPAIRKIWGNANGLVANSKGLKELALRFCDEYPVSIINNGVDTEVFKPRHKEGDGDPVTLLFISRLIERKGLQFIIPKMRKIREATNRDVRLLIVGDGPYRLNLEQMTKKEKIENQVIFFGQKDKKELPALYQQGDFFIFPSQKEGMPNAVLEAMACGLPIVMSPCQGSEELIAGNGIIADANMEEFYESIIKMIKLDQEEKNRMAHESRERAVKLFSWESKAGEYLSLFNTIIQEEKYFS